MKNLLLSLVILCGAAQAAFAQARIMNAGEAWGQLVVLSSEDILKETPKYKSLNPLSIPVFAELPLDMSVVAGAITLKQQNLLSHVQLKSRARHTPNLDISDLKDGLNNPLLINHKDGAWVRMLLSPNGEISISPATEAQAIAFYEAKKMPPVTLKADATVNTIFSSADMGSKDSVYVGSKSANYAELAKLLNLPNRIVVRPGLGIPFYYYDEFINSNPKVKAALAAILRDPLMNKVARVSYRKDKLTALQELMKSPESVVNENLITDLITRFDKVRFEGLPRNIKLRSSTNSEDLPNFNGAGLYDSVAYKPVKDGVEKTPEQKREILRKALKEVWASVWNLRAFDERNYFNIPHAQVKMGIQVNPTFGRENADGVVVTKNVARQPGESELGVYIEVQRGDKHGVANPVAGVKPQKVLVTYDPKAPMNFNAYVIKVLQNSNIADDDVTILPHDNPVPVMTEAEIKDLAMQSLKATEHFRNILDSKNAKFALDLEFKVDSESNGVRGVYIKQARPYID